VSLELVALVLLAPFKNAISAAAAAAEPLLLLFFHKP
jgi:hypothetical protein